MSQEVSKRLVSKWVVTRIYPIYQYIGELPHLLTIDPKFLGHPLGGTILQVACCLGMLEEKYAPAQPPRVESIKVAGGWSQGWSTPSRAELPYYPWNDMGKGGHWEKTGALVGEFPEIKILIGFVFFWKKSECCCLKSKIDVIRNVEH